MSTDPSDDISPDNPVDDVPGIGKSRRESLEHNGIETVEDLQRTDLAELVSVLPDDVAQRAKGIVGDRVEVVTSASEARERAQGIPGAKAKVVKGPGGQQNPKVLEKVAEQQLDGATVEIHKG